MNNIISPLLVSIEITMIAGMLATIIATAVAYILYDKKFKGKTLLELLILLPIVLPPSVIGFILLISFGTNSLLGALSIKLLGHTIIFTKTAAILASFIVAFPIMYQGAKITFKNIDKQIIEAATLDMASFAQVTKYVVLPISKYSLASSSVLAFARAFGEFGATLMVAGNIPGKTQTMPIAIYMAMNVNDRKLAFVYVSIMILISSLFLIITQKLLNNNI